MTLYSRTYQIEPLQLIQASSAEPLQLRPRRPHLAQPLQLRPPKLHQAELLHPVLIEQSLYGCVNSGLTSERAPTPSPYLAGPQQMCQLRPHQAELLHQVLIW